MSETSRQGSAADPAGSAGLEDEERPRLRKLSAWLLERYGERVFKVSLRGGFTCPNRDGRIGGGGCAFCAGDALEPVGYRPGSTVTEQLAEGMAYIRRRHGARRFIAYFQDYSATYAPPSGWRASTSRSWASRPWSGWRSARGPTASRPPSSMC